MGAVTSRGSLWACNWLRILVSQIKKDPLSGRLLGCRCHVRVHPSSLPTLINGWRLLFFTYTHYSERDYVDPEAGGSVATLATREWGEKEAIGVGMDAMCAIDEIV